jgi:quercetin dioxygenase-like cupin family protein
MDVLFQIIEGKGTITIGDEAQVALAGDFVVSPREIPHGLKADQGSVFSVFVIKIPNTLKSAVK